MDIVIMPKELTAENGAKALLIGEFFEEVETENPDYCGCGECDFCEENPDEEETYLQKVYVSWTTIKEIYKKAVDKLRVSPSKKVMIDSDWLIAVDSLLSCLKHRHGSTMERIGELEEVTKLGDKAREYYNDFKSR